MIAVTQLAALRRQPVGSGYSQHRPGRRLREGGEFAVARGAMRRKIEPDPKQPRLIVTAPGEGYRFDGLAKSPLSGQGPTMAGPSSGNDGALREDALSDAPERRAERGLLEDEAKQAPLRAKQLGFDLRPSDDGRPLNGKAPRPAGRTRGGAALARVG